MPQLMMDLGRHYTGINSRVKVNNWMAPVQDLR